MMGLRHFFDFGPFGAKREPKRAETGQNLKLLQTHRVTNQNLREKGT